MDTMYDTLETERDIRRMKIPRPRFPDIWKQSTSEVLEDIGVWVELGSRYIVLQLIRLLGFVFRGDRWKPFFDKERWELQFNTRRAFLFLFSLLWTGLLWLGSLYKCAYSSVTEFVSYFTNISFAYQAIYFLLYTLSFLGDPRKRSLEFFVLFGFFINMFAQVCIVFILVLGVFLDAPGLVIGETKTGGGQYDDGVVLVAERLYHVFPLMVALVILFMCWRDYSDILILIFANVYCLPVDYNGEHLCKHERCAFQVNKKQAWCYIIFNYIMAFIPLLLYYNIVDLRKIYHLDDFPTYAAFLLMIGINFFAVIFPLIFQFYSTIPSREVPSELISKDINNKVVVIPYGIPLPS